MENVRIQDDLYTFINQKKLEELVIPDDQPCTGGFNTLAVDVEKIISEQPSEITKYLNFVKVNPFEPFKAGKYSHSQRIAAMPNHPPASEHLLQNLFPARMHKPAVPDYKGPGCLHTALPDTVLLQKYPALPDSLPV